MDYQIERVSAMPSQADSDPMLIAKWLHGKPKSTAKEYKEAIVRLDEFLRKPLQATTLDDLQRFVDDLDGLSVNTQKRIIASVKSLFSFAMKIGYLRFNVAAVLRTPKSRNDLAQRILSESDVMKMIYQTENKRDQVLIRLLYASGARISEVCGLTWDSITTNKDTGQVTLFGKGGKTRNVKLSMATWQALIELRVGSDNSEPVFKSRKCGGLKEVQVHRIVKAAATRAGIQGNVSAHWLRHSHASHALDRGANIALVRDTLGHSSLSVTSRYVHAKPDDSSAMHLGV